MPQTLNNRFLDSLDTPEREAILSHCKAMALPQKAVLFEPMERSPYVYFLTSGILSSITVTASGETAEVGLIGREGVVNALLLLGPANLATQGVIQIAASGYRISLSELQKVFRSSEQVRKGILEYVQAETVITARIAGCHRFHNTEQRMARWLLMVQDRTGSDELHLTQTFLAVMLGTGRPTVTLVMQGLERRGLLKSARGHVTILDRPGLESVVCECYQTTRQLLDGLYR